jgi:hypothetical protein
MFIHELVLVTVRVRTLIDLALQLLYGCRSDSIPIQLEVKGHGRNEEIKNID